MQNSAKIAFLDTEISTTSGKIENIGLVFDDFGEEKISISDLNKDFAEHKPDFISGHNFVNFDKKYLANTSFKGFVEKIPIIDTLYLSLLLCPDKATHKLEKPYKQDLDRETPENSPLKDAKNTQILFKYLDEIFERLSVNLQQIFVLLLSENEFFKGYFIYKNIQINSHLNELLQAEFSLEIEHFESFLSNPVEFAFALSFMNLLRQKDAHFFSPFILKNHALAVTILKKLSALKAINLENFAMDNFMVEKFRDFDTLQTNLFDENSATKNAHKISQKEIIKSALNNESFLAILPTGGGKTLTFQLPALIKARQYKGLTVVISPLQALMQDHINNFKQKNKNFKMDAISSYLNPIERKVVFEELKNGSLDILYLAPESLRSNSIFKALQHRYIERFVIDEAHCFSMWGHNFRQDYHFIAQSIRDLEKSTHQDKIPISCFTATAKPEVIADIKRYFNENLGLNLKEFIASSTREGLSYEVLRVEGTRDKFEKLCHILNERQDEKGGAKNPTIIYIPQNARLCKELCAKLQEQFLRLNLNLEVEPFYAKLDDDIKEGRKMGRDKAQILKDFKENNIDIIVATTAFGMGIDKEDIQTIIHYELSDSLESYIQEAGRGARGKDKNGVPYTAKCYILYDEKDIDRNFLQLRRSNLDFGEIVKLVSKLKDEFKKSKNNEVYISLRTLHKRLGKDISEFDSTIIKTALLELEKADIIKRLRYQTQIFATSLKFDKDKMGKAHQILDEKKQIFDEKSKNQQRLNADERDFLRLYDTMVLIIQNIIQKSKEKSTISLDELSDFVGNESEKDMVIALKILENYNLIAKEDDIELFVNFAKASKNLDEFLACEREFFKDIKPFIEKGQSVDLREFNNENLKRLKALDSRENPLYILKFMIQSWDTVLKINQMSFQYYFKDNKCFFEKFEPINKLENAIKARQIIAKYALELIEKNYPKNQDGTLVLPTTELFELVKEHEKVSLNGFHYTLANMSEILNTDFDIKRGRLIYHQREHIEFNPQRISEPKPYRREHYDKSFKIYMKQKIANVHLFKSFLDNFSNGGENAALSFIKNYFSLDKNEFLKLYKLNAKRLENPISQALLDKIIKNLSIEQKNIIEDESKAIMILAGPGSGKTKTLVHKIAHLLTAEDKKSENFLMLAHSRTAVSEFKSRLYGLLGEQAYEVKIMTFHAFALTLLGEKVKNNADLKDKIPLATIALKSGEISLPYIEMLVLDEYQDINSQSYEFIKAIYAQMSDERQIIAVGDDDQCIFDFLGANSYFIKCFKNDFKLEQGEIATHELVTNYRSNQRLVNFANVYRKNFLKNGCKSADLKANSKNIESGFVGFTHYQMELSFANLALCVNKFREFLREQNRQKEISIAVLVRDNDEVCALRYEFERLNIKTHQILDKDGFELKNLIEIWEFIEFLKNGKRRDEAFKFIESKYKDSENLPLFKSVVNRFETEFESGSLSLYDKMLQREIDRKIMAFNFENFVQDLSFNEFEKFNTKDEIIISTMHKAKGKEFDFVFVGIDKKIAFYKNEEKRLLYVAFTRAKSRLFIHSASSALRTLNTYCDKSEIYEKKDENPRQISYIMSLKDIYLSYYTKINEKIQLISGKKCEVKITNDNEKHIDIFLNKISAGRLSNELKNKILAKCEKGYELCKDAKIKYVVQWDDKNNQHFKPQLLCEITLIKSNST